MALLELGNIVRTVTSFLAVTENCGNISAVQWLQQYKGVTTESWAAKDTANVATDWIGIAAVIRIHASYTSGFTYDTRN